MVFPRLGAKIGHRIFGTFEDDCLGSENSDAPLPRCVEEAIKCGPELIAGLGEGKGWCKLVNRAPLLLQV